MLGENLMISTITSSILFSLISVHGPDWIEKSYENLPSIQVEGGRFNPNSTSRTQDEAYLAKCREQMTAEEINLSNVVVSKFVTIMQCSKITYAANSVAYRGKIIFLAQ